MVIKELELVHQDLLPSHNNHHQVYDLCFFYWNIESSKRVLFKFRDQHNTRGMDQDIIIMSRTRKRSIAQHFTHIVLRYVAHERGATAIKKGC